MTTTVAAADTPAVIHHWPDWLGIHNNPSRDLRLLPRRSPAAQFPWWERHDLWSNDQMFARPIVWRPWGRDEWIERVDATGRVARHKTRIAQTEPLPPEKPGRPRTHIRHVIATLIGWHQATTRQLAAWVGMDRDNLTKRVLRPLWHAGILTRGTFGTAYGRVDHVWQLVADDPLFHWLANLDPDDWLHVTLGATPTVPSPHHRHNLLVTELTLRAAEAVPVTAVFGESAVTATNLFSGYTGPNLRGDAAFVRPDGLRIVIELVRQHHARGFTSKLAAWGRYLGTVPGAHRSGTVICFVFAADDLHSLGTHLRAATEQTLTAEGLADPVTGAPASPRTVAYARTQITVAAWPDWFPRPHDLSTDFASLTAHYLDERDRWGTTRLADPTSFTFRSPHPERFTLPVNLVHDLWSTPQPLDDPLTDEEQQRRRPG